MYQLRVEALKPSLSENMVCFIFVHETQMIKSIRQVTASPARLRESYLYLVSWTLTMTQALFYETKHILGTSVAARKIYRLLYALAFPKNNNFWSKIYIKHLNIQGILIKPFF